MFSLYIQHINVPQIKTLNVYCVLSLLTDLYLF